ncbi:MAG: SprT family zinc-dependent metalloprotease [Candidatus Bipolaricaulota bacterium]|nr:SprT family zinc-dependent metalloprotease [Candidatus Bipolaricaulota bacterium]
MYTIRESVRAKHVILKISVHDGLVVVVPRGFDVRQVPKIIDEKREWIERESKRIEQRRNTLDTELAPGKILLRAINEEWMVAYEQNHSSRIAVDIPGKRRLILSGNTADHALIRMALRSFLIAKARMELPELLLSLADEHGFLVTKVSVRFQKTRWGTCSTQDAISLNAKLLLLPRDIANYVMIHELCHTVHHNHSTDFWQLVQEHLPQAQILRRTLLDEAWRFVPLWLEGQYKGSR